MINALLQLIAPVHIKYSVFNRADECVLLLNVMVRTLGVFEATAMLPVAVETDYCVSTGSQ